MKKMKKIDVLAQMRTTQQIENPYFTFFFYGSTGSGKTTAAATFPSPLFLVPANEQSHLTLLSHGDDYPFLVVGKDEHGRRLPIQTHMAAILGYLEEAHATFRKLERQGQQLEATGKAEEAKEIFAKADQVFPYQTIVVESLTHYCDLVVEDLSQHGQKPMNQADWGKLSTHVRTIHDRLRSLDAHIVYTALDKVSEGEGSIVTGGPNLVGSLRDKLPSACDAIAYFNEMRTKEGSVYRAHFRKFKFFAARARFPLPDFIDNFNFQAPEVQQALKLKG